MTGWRPGTYRVLVVGGAVVLGGLVVHGPAAVALVVPTVLGLLALLALTNFLSRDMSEAQRRRVLRWTIGAFALHLGIGLVITSSSAITRYLGGDALTYHLGATDIVQHWRTGVPLPRTLAPGKEGFFYLLAGLYWLFGPHSAAGIAVNATLAAACVPLMTDVTRRLFGDEAAHYAPPLLLLIPGFLLWPSQLLREAGILFLVAAAANCATRLREQTRLSVTFVLAMSVAALFTFRGIVGLTLLVSLCLAIPLSRRRLLAGFGTGLSTLTLVGVLVFGMGIGYSAYHSISGTDLQQADAIRLDSSTAQSGFFKSANISTPTHAAYYIPVALPLFVLGPFPWQAASSRQVLGLPDALVWWALLPSLLAGMKLARQRFGRRLLMLLLPSVVIAASLSLLIANFGTVVRERLQIIILLVPLIALGRVAKRTAKARASARSQLELSVNSR